MKILGLIPARSGSKRLPGKNIRCLGGMPLIAWTIQSAIKSSVFEDVMVSTDDPEIAEISRSYGALVLSMRPGHLATDNASSVDVALHSLQEYEDERFIVDGLMLLQPTSPFRTVSTIRCAVNKFISNGCKPVVGVSCAESHPAWCFYINNEQLIPVIDSDQLNTRSQDLRPVYTVNGAIYIATPSSLRESRSFITENTYPLIISDFRESIDIDTEWDWLLADAIVNREEKNEGSPSIVLRNEK